jgi:hypothetical protein
MATEFIEQKAGELPGIIIDRGNSWKTKATFDFDISEYTISPFIKWGSNTTNLTVTPIDDYNVTISLSNTQSAAITTIDNVFYLRLTYNTETRDYIKTLFKVLQ